MINWELKKFEQLTVHQLYTILALRSEVFVVEQNCPYLDEDGKDLKSWHLMGWNEENILVAYTRILKAGDSFAEASIGRVVSSPKVRGTGIGKILMQKSIEQLYQLFGEVPIRIGAQRYLEKFYESLGFVIAGAPYLEDNIPHVEMIKY
jgi:ElaA protein